MGKKTESLADEILNNVRKDRAQVERVRDHIIDIVENESMSEEPLGMLGIAENVAKLSDVLTKMNAQLVELTKINVKHDKDTDDPKTEKESIFDEIESSGSGDDAN